MDHVSIVLGESCSGLKDVYTSYVRLDLACCIIM